ATDAWAQDVLIQVSWVLAVAVAAGLVVQWVIGRLLRRPRAALARLAPRGNGNGNGNGTTEDPEEPDGEARAERGETEPPRRRLTAALTLLMRLPLVLARLLLDLIPVFGFAVISHAIATAELGGETLARTVCGALIDAYIIYAALICIAEMMFS